MGQQDNSNRTSEKIREKIRYILYSLVPLVPNRRGEAGIVRGPGKVTKTQLAGGGRLE